MESDIYTEPEYLTESVNTLSLYTIVNYMKTAQFFPKFMIENNVLRNKEFTRTFKKLVDMSIIMESSETGNYILNSQFRDDISTLHNKIKSKSPYLTVETKIKRDSYRDLIYC